MNYDSNYGASALESLEPTLGFQDGEGLQQFTNIDALCGTYLGNDDGSFQDAGDGLQQPFHTVAIRHWTGEECYEWATSVCQAYGLDGTEANLCSFSGITGAELKHLSAEQFSNMCGGRCGKVLYKEFRMLRKSLRESKQTNLDEKATSVYDVDSWKLSREEFQDLDRYIPKHENWNALPEDLLNMDLKDYDNDGYRGQDDDEYEEEQEDDDATSVLADSSASSLGFQSQDLLSYEGGSDAVTLKVKTRSRRGERTPKIYEFLMRLLADPRTNPQLIRWKDITTATFILVQPDLVAQLWGARSQKLKLSANNFARALRYHYNTGGLISVSERHYMYRCGPKSLKYLTDLNSTSSSSSSSSSS